jgi:hypothetical protein
LPDPIVRGAVVSAFRSSVIDAPLEQVSTLVGDFGALAGWVPFVIRCEIEGGASPNEVGAVRRVEQDNDVNVRERLVALSEADHSYRYAFIEGNIPIRRYEANVRLFPSPTATAPTGTGAGNSRSTRTMRRRPWSSSRPPGRRRPTRSRRTLAPKYASGSDPDFPGTASVSSCSAA